jgi:type VI secretion system secreted protein VgrG
MDETGLLQVEHHPTTQQYTLKLANGTSYTIPVADQYRGNADNGALANSGFHFYEGQGGTGASAVDRARHRTDYNKLLSPDTDA